MYFRIEHNMKQGKHGVIDVKVGNPERIHKDKSGHLLIVSILHMHKIRSQYYMLRKSF